MNVKYLPPPFEVRQGHFDHSVKPSRTSQSSVQQAHSIRCCHYYHICISSEAIHFH